MPLDANYYQNVLQHALDFEANALSHADDAQCRALSQALIDRLESAKKLREGPLVALKKDPNLVRIAFSLAVRQMEALLTLPIPGTERRSMENSLRSMRGFLRERVAQAF